MTNKAYFLIVICFMLMTSCRENRTDQDRELNTEQNEFSPVDRNIPRENIEEDDFEENEPTRRDSSGVAV